MSAYPLLDEESLERRLYVLFCSVRFCLEESGRDDGAIVVRRQDMETLREALSRIGVQA